MVQIWDKPFLRRTAEIGSSPDGLILHSILLWLWYEVKRRKDTHELVLKEIFASLYFSCFCGARLSKEADYTFQPQVWKVSYIQSMQLLLDKSLAAKLGLWWIIIGSSLQVRRSELFYAYNTYPVFGVALGVQIKIMM